jgi:hypothetical protein
MFSTNRSSSPNVSPKPIPPSRKHINIIPGRLFPTRIRSTISNFGSNPAKRASPKITSIASRRPCRRCTVAVADRNSLWPRRSSPASPLPPQPWVSPAPRRGARLGPPHCPVAISPHKESFFIRLARVIAHNGSNGTHRSGGRCSARPTGHGARSTSTTRGTLIDEIAARAAARGALHPRQHALDL